MISGDKIRKRAEEWKIREEIVEKDYVLGWLLWDTGLYVSYPIKSWIQFQDMAGVAFQPCQVVLIKPVVGIELRSFPHLCL
jgi:hypothetical protein